VHQNPHQLTSDFGDGGSAGVEPGFFTGAALALMCTGVAGGTALLLATLSPWAGWGYAGLALAIGLVLELHVRFRPV
jgi:hypothetical protein